MKTSRTDIFFSGIRKATVAAVITVSVSLTYGCANLQIPQGTEIVQHSSGKSTTFSIDAIRQCIEQNCRTVHFHNEPQELDPDSIAVLNWNIYKSQRKNWVPDFREFSRGQDIVIIQEAMLHPDLTNSLNEHGLNWNLSTGFEYKTFATGVLTASQVKAVRQSGMRTTEPIVRLPKTTLISHYDLRNEPKQLLVANIHGINFTLGRQAYSAQIQALEAALVQHDGPIIVAGDFNSWSRQRQHILERMIGRLKLQSLSYENHNRTKVFGKEIDHVFYRGLVPVKVETREVTSSDHNPIMVLFRLPHKELDVAQGCGAATICPDPDHWQ